MGYEREEAGRRPRFLTWAAGWVVMPFPRRENRKTSRFGWGVGVRGNGSIEVLAVRGLDRPE